MNLLSKYDNLKTLSEQANAGADVGAIMRELDKTNSDESAIVNIVKKYKDKASFKNFTDQYKTISGKDFGTDVFRAIQPYNDKTEWADLSNHLKSMGITLGTATTNRGNSSMATLTGLDTPAAAATTDPWAKYPCVVSHPNAKKTADSSGGVVYLINGVYYYGNGRKMLANRTMGNYTCNDPEFKTAAAGAALAQPDPQPELGGAGVGGTPSIVSPCR